jgi:hypothetical protein
MRVGFACQEDEEKEKEKDLMELPLGVHPRSYAYSSSGKLANHAKTLSTKNNEPFGKLFLTYLIKELEILSAL